jgi:hypothetical protein
LTPSFLISVVTVLVVDEGFQWRIFRAREDVAECWGNIWVRLTLVEPNARGVLSGNPGDFG